MMTEELIIIGGGASTRPYFEQGLLSKISGKLVLSLNSCSFFFLENTANVFVDESFYRKNLELVKELPLCIGQKTNNLFSLKQPNTILLPINQKYDRTLSSGVYTNYLSGLFALSLGIYLIGKGTIYLFGLDGGSYNDGKVVEKIDKPEDKKITHWYQGKEIHRGLGLTSPYYSKRDKNNEMFSVFKDLEGIKIYNVSPTSRINIFEKIDYTRFLELYKKEDLDQNKLREEIKIKLEGKQ